MENKQIKDCNLIDNQARPGEVKMMKLILLPVDHRP